MDYRLRLIDAIVSVFSKGLVLGTEELHYLESAIGDSRAKSVADIFSSEQDFEQQAFAQLVFFPDEVLQERLEPLLSGTDYTIEDRDAIIDALTRRRMQTTLYFPDQKVGIKIHIPEDALRLYVCRLNIEKTVAPEIGDTLNRCISDPAEINRVRVRVRNSRSIFCGAALSFFCRCIEKLHSDARYFRDSLDLILELLQPPQTDDDYYGMLAAQKYRCLKMLHDDRKTRNDLVRQNTEILMLKGMHVGAVNTGAVIRQIELIDHICLSVFGRMEFQHSQTAGEAPLDVDISDGTEEMDRILRLLS